MPYKDNRFTNNIEGAPTDMVGANPQSDEPIKHNGAISKPEDKKKPFYLQGFFYLCVFSLICLVLFFVYRLNPHFSEFFVRYISGPLRMILSAVTSIIPFSLAESIILFMPIGIIMFYFFIFRSMRREDDAAQRKCRRFLFWLVLILLDTFFLTVAPSYQRLPLNENLGIENRQITPERLKNTCEIMVDMLNRDAAEIYYGANGMSYSREEFSQLSDEILRCYGKFSKKHDFIFPIGFRAKPVALSEPMTYMHVSGVYTYFTGEANINVNYPDYVLPHTVAHEMSHARGIFNEGDANFVGFLVCLESDNPYVRYSGLMSIFPYITDALYYADPLAYTEVMRKLSVNIFYEFDAFSKFFEKYTDSGAAQISGAINDTYLKVNGQAEGIKSYGLVVDLTVNYLEEHYDKANVSA